MIYNYDNCAGIGVPREAFVDGVKVEGLVVEADTDAGYVLVTQVDDNGNFIAHGEELATDRIEGVVTVVPAIDG